MSRLIHPPKHTTGRSRGETLYARGQKRRGGDRKLRLREYEGTAVNNVYTFGVDAPYEWDEDGLTNLQAAGVDWRDALHVLYHARPRVRSHLGAVLRIAAPARDGRYLAVALIELGDDRYRVVSGRWLDDDEQQAVRKLLEGGR